MVVRLQETVVKKGGNVENRSVLIRGIPEADVEEMSLFLKNNFGEVVQRIKVQGQPTYLSMANAQVDQIAKLLSTFYPLEILPVNEVMK